MAARRHVTNKLWTAYARASKRDKTKVIDEAMATTGMGRSTARRMLTGPALLDPAEQIDRRRLRPKGYSDDSRALLEHVWALMGCPCGKYLTVMLELWLPLLQGAGDLDRPFTTPQTIAELEAMSAATIDRYLAPARKVDEADALDHVFGYTTLLDMTMRGGEDRSTRKSFETFTPIGPWIVTADEFGDPDSANLRCWVNSALRQDASTADLIWNVARLVSYASWVTTLEPGDIIATGTPAGVGPIVDGDIIEVEVDRIGGRLGITVSSNGAVESHTLGHGKGPVPPPPPAHV